MNTFSNAVLNQEDRTQNGMKARASTANACVDLFFKIGAMRGQDAIPAFTAAYVENPDIATRIALWARDVREGAGERKIFRDILKNSVMSRIDGPYLQRMIDKSVELGRWDDILVVLESDCDVELQSYVIAKIGSALERGEALAAKWMPRQGPTASKIRNAFGMTPKQWRKTLVNLTKVVETQMCDKDWDNINFNHVPSVASARYKKAFSRNTPKYAEWAQSLVKADPKDKNASKVNAGAVYPYDVIKGVSKFGYYDAKYSADGLAVIVAQWEALPNYIGEANILPMVDVSGSMDMVVSGSITAMDVAVSLGLYCADKNKGKFKDLFLTFSGEPKLLLLTGNINQKIAQMVKSNWSIDTNLHAAFEKVLSTAIKGSVPQEEMPQTLLILSDMQFNQCVKFDDSAFEMMKRKYDEAGYQMPGIVFWNITAKSNVPVTFDTRGVALVSGFSPSIMKAVLSTNMSEMTPEGIMLHTVMNDRYS